MDKVLALLEKHVQWLALAIGALFLGMMAYSYVVQEPVTVKVAGQDLTPGQIDQTIASMPEVRTLKLAAESTRQANPVPTVQKPSIELVKQLNKQPELPNVAVERTTTVGPNGNVPDPYKFLQLVNLPAAMYDPMNSFIARAVIVFQKAQPPVAAVPAPGAPAAAPLPPTAVAPAQVETRDVDYIAHKFTVSLKDLVEAMKTAKMDLNGIPNDPTDPSHTTTDPRGVNARFQFLSVELVRQEKSPINGDWDPKSEKILGALPGDELLVRGLPKPTATASERFEYAQWAAANLRMILQPTFPQVSTGQPWYVPGTTPTPAIDAPAGGTSPAMPAPVNPGAFAPPAAAMPGRPMINPPMDRPMAGVPGVGVAPGMPAAVPGVAAPAAPAQPGQIPGEGQPNGMFNPNDFLQVALASGTPAEVDIYANDITCLPGRTYRYKLRYKMRNPAWQVSSEIKKEVAEPFVLVSPDSVWTPPMTIPPRVKVFAKAIEKPVPGSPNGEVVQLDVFVSQEGRWKPKMLRLTAGDLIAKEERDGKWNSGWVVSDIRKDPKRKDKYYVILVDSAGQIRRADPESDLVSKEYIDLQTQSGLLPPPGTVAPAPSIPGVPPPLAPAAPGSGERGRGRGAQS